MSLTRRNFLRSSAAATSGLTLLGGAAGATAQSWLPALLPASDPQSPPRSHAYPFQHGVASGDPLTDGVMLWTRISPPPDWQGPLAYRWHLALDPLCQWLVATGEGSTDASRDFTVKEDVRGLSAGQTYYYLFEALGQISDTGRTRTLPQGRVEHLRLAYTSCANYACGHFNVYRDIAARADLDAVLHLGDYLYEDADHERALVSGRLPLPARELLSLDDCRTRHACYKSDPDLQEVHRQHPFLLIWDDHEFADNAWPGGAQNHTEGDLNRGGEGAWTERLAAARQAYFEWMPVREQPHGGLYRNVRCGDLLDLNLLDTRLAGRDQQATTLEQRNQPERTLLGAAQEDWLQQQLQQSVQDGVCWNLLGQQVMLAQLGTNSMPFNYDQWDGYPAARQRLFDSVRAAGAENLVVLTGDIHSSWALELHDDPFASAAGQPIGVELVTPAVTSPGIEQFAQARLAAHSLTGLLPHLNFVDFYHRGYVLLDITHQRLQAQWWVVDNIRSPRYVSECLRALDIPAGRAQLQPAATLAGPVAAPALAPQAPAELAWLRHWQSAPALNPQQALASHAAPAHKLALVLPDS